MIEGHGSETAPQKHLNLVNEIEGLSGLIQHARRLVRRIGGVSDEKAALAGTPNATEPSLLHLLENGPQEIIEVRNIVGEILNEIETLLFG